MKRALLFVTPLAGMFAISSCSGPTVPLSLGFPSNEAFLVTTSIDIEIVPLGESTDQCAPLLGNAIQGTDVHASISALGLAPCDVLHGITLPDPGSGAFAYIVLGRATNGVILAGCRVGDAYPGAPAIEVDLYPTTTAAYSTAVTAAHLAPGSTAAQRCGGSTP
jgi:hypothetical protein